MTYATVQPHDFASFDRSHPGRTVLGHVLSSAVALALGGAMGAWMLHATSLPGPAREPGVAVVVPIAAPVRRDADLRRDAAAFGPAFSLNVPPTSMADSAPLGPALVPFAQPAAPFAVAAAEPVIPAPALVVADAEVVSPERLADDPAGVGTETVIPLPMPRPLARRNEANQALLRPPVRASGRRVATAAPVPFDDRNFIQKLFGLGQPSNPALGYAAAEDDIPGRGLTSAVPAGPGMLYDRQTAIYNIATHTVYMPDGSRLEAHSGLGDRLDDPRHVHERMRGATPPHVYELTPREQLFHGVQALRLTPVGGGGVFGRVGLLAHTYMLGPKGDSNGCVSFRNYEAFLQAYKNGKVRHLAVVAGL